MTTLRQVVILTRDLAASKTFYQKALGLEILREAENFVELDIQGSETTIALKQATSEASCSTGYSPILSFNVPDISTTVNEALSHGAHLDGPIKYPAYGKIAALRSPDGIMLSIFESE